MSLLDLACQQRWAMRLEELRALLGIIGREALDPDLARQIREDRATRPSALAARSSSKLDNTRAVAMRDGVAIIEVIGPIVRRADLFSEISGASDVGTLARDFETARAAPNVEAILLVFDTPGGEVTGVPEFAAMIYAARADKPIWAYGEGLVASAGYWLACSTEQIVLAKTALAGSIGVVMPVRDPAKTKTDQIEFVSSQSPNKRPDPNTETGRQQLQQIVDSTAAEFVSDVAIYRGVDEQTVLGDFGQGGVLVGKAAVQAGLADRIGSFEGTLADIRTAAQKQRERRMRGTMEGSMPPEKKSFWASFWEGARDAGVVPEHETALGAQVAATTPVVAASAASAMPEQDARTAQVAATTPVVAASAASAMPEQDARTAQVAEENAKLRAELDKVRRAQITADAEAFVQGHITAGRALPAEATALGALYTALAYHDAGIALEAGTNLPTLLRAAIEARPANQLSAQLIPNALPAGSVALANGNGAAALLDEADRSARAYAKRANGTR